MTKIKAVLFDLGGVILESPLHTLFSFEAEQGHPPGSVGRIVSNGGGTGAWARHERGEISAECFYRCFGEEARQMGLDLDVAQMMRRIESGVGVRPLMVAAVRRLRREGFLVGAVTNNWKGLDMTSATENFEMVVESWVEGVRKPEPEIYRLALSRLGVEAAEAVMLDDIGANLKTARQMGMATIKVTDPTAALEELGALVGVALP